MVWSTNVINCSTDITSNKHIGDLFKDNCISFKNFYIGAVRIVHKQNFINYDLVHKLQENLGWSMVRLDCLKYCMQY